MIQKYFFDISNKKFLFVLTLAGLIVRLIAWKLVGDQNFPDANTYYIAGKALFETGIMDVHVAMPLYPILAYLFGGKPGIVFFDQIISALTIPSAYLLCLEIFKNSKAARITALISCFYPFFLFYSFAAITETLYLFLLIWTFIFFYRKSYAPAILLSIFILYLRPTTDLINPLLIFCFAYLIHKESLKKAMFLVIGYFATYTILMSPWWYHNYQKYDTFVRLNLGAGFVLYSGNNPLNKSGGGYEGPDLDASKFRLIEDPIERDQALKKAAVDFIKSDPQNFAYLGYLKFIRFWRLWPYRMHGGGPHHIVASIMSYGVVLLLTLIYLFKYIKRDWIILSPILLFTAYLTAVHMVTIGSIRYRFPLEVFLIVISAQLLALIYDRSFSNQS